MIIRCCDALQYRSWFRSVDTVSAQSQHSLSSITVSAASQSFLLLQPKVQLLCVGSQPSSENSRKDILSTLSNAVPMSAGDLLHLGPCTVAVDKFIEHNASAFFLTHMHTDHMQGLRDSFAGPIYCSEITRVLLQHKWPELTTVTPLPLLETFSVRLNCQMAFSVTTFQASHCPVSVTRNASWWSSSSQ
jgi:hypothetical protein